MGIALTSYIIDIIAPECKKWRGPFEKIGVWKRSKSDALRLGGNAKHRCTSGVQKNHFIRAATAGNTVKMHKLSSVLCVAMWCSSAVRYVAKMAF